MSSAHAASINKPDSHCGRDGLTAPSASVKVEPVDLTISRKRSFKAEDDAPYENATLHAKKMKSETPKKPLSIMNGNTNVKEETARDDMIYAADLRTKIENVQMQMSHIQTLLSGLQRKRRKTKADSTRITKYDNQLRELRVLKEKYNAAIPSAPPAPLVPALPASFGKMESRPAIVHNAAPQPVASGSNVQLPAAYGARPLDAGSSNVQTEAIHDRIDLQGASRVGDDERFDEDGNFYGRGRDNFAGPVAKADDVDKFLVAAGNAEQFDGNASVDKALEKLGLEGQYRPLPGMEIALMPHQTIGVAWMLDKEKSSYKGGCLSDEMGLGKTVQMIAVMVTNRSEDPLCKANLIIAPVALLDQWQLEIEMKTNCGLKCLIYHGSNKPKKRKDLVQYDVILTTFQTLALEWPDEEAEEKKAKQKAKKKRREDELIKSDSEDTKTSKRKKKQETGLLMQMEWYRVVIDEAQNIRNKRTRVSRAVTKLKSNYRWCLTGTPIINCLQDAYGLLRFLHIRPWYDWTEFNSHIALLEKKNPAVATRRLQAIFASMLLRRKKDSMLDGKRLIELPSKEIILTKLQFTLEERDIYKMVELKSQAIFNRFLRAGTVLKNYHQVLVLLLRLRQVCSHPCLIQEGSEAFVSAPDLEERNIDSQYELSRARQLVSPEFVENMQTRMKQIMDQRMESEKESADATVEDEECPICYDAFNDPVVTACGHIFCSECILNVFNVEPVDHDQARYKPDERPCPACRGIVTKQKLFSRSAFEPMNNETNDIAGGSGNQGIETAAVLGIVDDHAEGSMPKPGRTLRGRKPRNLRVYDSDEEEYDDGLSDFIVEDDENEDETYARRALKKRLGKRRATVLSDDEVDDDVICGAKPDVGIPPEQVKMMPKFLPSTKMKHMMESLRAWAESHPDEKTLIISQWTQCLQLVSDYLSENGFLHVKYQGDMNRQKRDQAVRVFMSKDKATIMLMSLKCGGVGLNLTRANRVISLDLGWSEAVESQAFDRVHRLGQTRTVFVHRLVIADTVEDRVLALQERKKNLADSSLGEGNGKKIGRLSVREIANLFGLDHKGRLLSNT